MKLIYESPKRDNAKSNPHRSSPIDAEDAQSRKVLEAKGWRIVETIEDAPAEAEPPLLPVLDAVEPVEGAASVVSDEPLAPSSPGTTASELGLSAEQWIALQEAGFDTPEALRKATDDELRAVKGIGAAAVRNLRKALITPEG